MLRLGLCCLFKHEAVSFRTTTAKALSFLPRDRQLLKLSEICLHNTGALYKALETVQRLGIGAFRIMSPLFPRITHPEAGYSLSELPDSNAISTIMESCRTFAATHDIRLSFHPDQFVVLSSPHPAVVASSIRELMYQAWLAEALGVNVINIHAGGVYGDKQAALQRFETIYCGLPESVRHRLTLENDDVSFTPEELLPLCQRRSIPLVYDIHHHRCNRDNLTEAEATELAGATWETVAKEQYCHISSPKASWNNGNPRPHADYIDPADIPECWLEKKMTVDVEAKAKELAVIRLQNDLRRLYRSRCAE